MREVQAGRTERFDELIDRYQAALARVAEGRLGRRDWAEEAVQETFLAAFKSRHTFDTSCHFRTWLWTILLNQCRAQWRARLRQPQIESWTDAARGTSSNAPTMAEGVADLQPPFAELVVRERRERLEQLLDRLPEAQAGALRLRFFGGLKFQEIADAMSCSLPTAKNRVRWGLLRLAQMTGQEERDTWNAAVEQSTNRAPRTSELAEDGR
jgi:RNA polymerase sigma-70 factor (ECF subfamily)